MTATPPHGRARPGWIRERYLPNRHELGHQGVPTRLQERALTPAAGSPAKAGPTRADDIRQMAVAAGVYSALTGLAYWRPTVGRRALGIVFAVMGLAWNGTLTVKAPEQFPMLAGRAPWGWYRRAGLALTEPAPRAFGAAMTVGETAVAAAILSPDPAARLGLLAVTAFSLGIAPLGLYTSGNPILAMGAYHLARQPWPTAAFSHRRPK